MNEVSRLLRTWSGGKQSALEELVPTAYQDFLAFWKDADLDIPILKKAKAEYAAL